MGHLDSLLLAFTEQCCHAFQRLTGRTNVWLAVQFTNLSIVMFFVWAGLYPWGEEIAPRILITVLCLGLLYVLSQTVFRVSIEAHEGQAYRRVAKGLRNPRRLRDAQLRVAFLTLSLLLWAPVWFVYSTLGVWFVLLSYFLVVLTTVIVYLLACDPLPPVAGKLPAWLRGLASSRLSRTEADQPAGPARRSWDTGAMLKKFSASVLLTMLAAIPVLAGQAPAPGPAKPFAAGPALKQSPNVKTYGGFRFSESIIYDESRDLYVAVSAGMPQDLVPNDGYVSLVNPDGTAHTLKWIGMTRDGLTLNHPLGSDIANGFLYVVDADTVRWFDLKTGEPRGNRTVEGATRMNDLAVAAGGTIYATQTGDKDPANQRVYKLTAQGQTTLVSGAPLALPNGVALDPEGNVVVVNIGSADVHTFSPDGKLLKTEQSTHAGNDGIVVLKDGTKYVSSVREGFVARIRPGQKAEVIASGIPSAASMTYDSKRHRLVIPMNDWNAISIVELER